MRSAVSMRFSDAFVPWKRPYSGTSTSGTSWNSCSARRCARSTRWPGSDGMPGSSSLAELFAEEHHDRLGVLALPGRHVALAFGLAPLMLGHAGDAATIAISASVASATPALCRLTKRLAR